MGNRQRLSARAGVEVTSAPQWKVERHGGGKHDWRVQFTGNEKPARNQLQLTFHAISQGGVRLHNSSGIVVLAYWRPRGNRRPMPIRFCIGCGCDDLHACMDAWDEPCSWILTDRKSATGVCSQCRRALKRWAKGDRILRANRT